MSKTRASFGLTGIPDAHPERHSFFLNPEEAAALRMSVLDELTRFGIQVDDMEAFHRNLRHAAFEHRAWYAIRLEHRRADRRENLRQYITWFERKHSAVSLTQINAMKLAELMQHPEGAGLSRLDAAKLLLAKLNALPKVRGAQPGDELDYTCHAVAEAFYQHTRRAVTMTKDGAFNAIVSCVVTAASIVGARDLKSRIERFVRHYQHLPGTMMTAKKLQPQTAADGREGRELPPVRTWTPTRFSE